MLAAALNKLPISTPPKKQHITFLALMLILTLVPLTQIIGGIIPILYGAITGEAATEGSSQPNPGIARALLFGTVVDKALLLVIPVAVAIRFGRPLSRKILGLDKKNFLPVLAYGLGAAIVLNVIVFAYAKLLSLKSGSEGILTQAGYGSNLLADFCLVLAIVTLAPAAEELLYRAFLQRTVRDFAARTTSVKLARWIGIAATSITFAALHLDDEQVSYFAVYLFFGFLCGYLYELTGDLRVPTLLHAANNGFAMATFKGVSLSPVTYILILAAIGLAVIIVSIVGQIIGDRDATTRTTSTTRRVE